MECDASQELDSRLSQERQSPGSISSLYGRAQEWTCPPSIGDRDGHDDVLFGEDDVRLFF